MASSSSSACFFYLALLVRQLLELRRALGQAISLAHLDLLLGLVLDEGHPGQARRLEGLQGRRGSQILEHADNLLDRGLPCLQGQSARLLVRLAACVHGDWHLVRLVPLGGPIWLQELWA